MADSPSAIHGARAKQQQQQQQGFEKNDSARGPPKGTEAVIWPEENKNEAHDAIVKFGKDIKAGCVFSFFSLSS